jgi:hypothetical protein
VLCKHQRTSSPNLLIGACVLMRFRVLCARRAGGRWCCRGSIPTPSMVRFPLILTQAAFALRAEDLPASCSQGARGTHSARSGPKSVARTLLSRSRLPALPLPPGNVPRHKGHVSCYRHLPPRPCSRTTLQSTPCTISALARYTPAPPQMPPQPSLFNPTAASLCLSSSITQLLFPALSPPSRPLTNATYAPKAAH